MRRSGPLLAVVLMLALVGGPARAHIVSDREIVILRGLPAGLLAGMSEHPNSLGYVGANHAGPWQHVEHQSSGLVGLMDACARADSTGAEAAWRVIDAAMRHQRPGGDYDAAGAETRARQLERTGWWIAQLCRAEVAVMNSPLQDRFRWRVALLLPKLRRSVDWLVAAGEELFTLHEGPASQELAARLRGSGQVAPTIADRRRGTRPSRRCCHRSSRPRADPASRPSR